MGKFALLIGVSNYSKGLNSLPAAQNDAKAFKEVLENRQLCRFDDVITLLNPERQAVAEAIEELFDDRGKDDVVLLYFSGHGIKDDRGNFYLATCTTKLREEGTLVRSTAISADFIHDTLEQSRSRRQIIILDCCFSGAFATGLTVKDDSFLHLNEQLGGEGRALLTSSNSTQYSFEQKDSKLSIYTQYIIEGIKTGAADQNDDHAISIDELHEYARQKVQEKAKGMKPEIYASKEGYKIVLSQIHVDPEVEYRKKVEQYIERGDFYISPLAQSSRRNSATPKALLNLRQSLGLQTEEAIAIEDRLFKPYWERQIKVLTASTEVNTASVLLELLEAKLLDNFSQLYQDSEEEYLNLAASHVRAAIERIDYTDSLVHTIEYSAWIVIVGLELLKGKQLQEGNVSPRDWLHVVLSLIFMHIGYVKGVNRDDRPKEFLFATGHGNDMVQLTSGATVASLTPYSADRARLFIKERFGGDKEIDAKLIQRYLSLIQFHVPSGLPNSNNKSRSGYPELIRAAAILGQISYPKFLKSFSAALFYEQEETGYNRSKDYKDLNGLRLDYRLFHQYFIHSWTKPFIAYLLKTAAGQQLLRNACSNLLEMTPDSQERANLRKNLQAEFDALTKIYKLDDDADAANNVLFDQQDLADDILGSSASTLADFNLLDSLISAFEIRLQSVYREIFGLQIDQVYAGIINQTTRKVLTSLDQCDALNRNANDTIRATLVGLEIIHGKHIREGGVTQKDWLHIALSLLCADVGYAQGACIADEGNLFATGYGDELVQLSPEHSAAALHPFHVDRSKRFIEEQFGRGGLIDAEYVKRCIEITRFPPPREDDYQDTITYPGLVRAGILIGELCDPRYLEKFPAIFSEYEETGINRHLDYRHPDDIRQNFPKYFWNSVFLYIHHSLEYLSMTRQGRQIGGSVYAKVFCVENDRSVVSL